MDTATPQKMKSLADNNSSWHQAYNHPPEIRKQEPSDTAKRKQTEGKNRDVHGGKAVGTRQYLVARSQSTPHKTQKYMHFHPSAKAQGR